MPDRPNIVFFHVDNLGMGELGCYGGVPRGADTRRADQFASEGPKLTPYVVEPQCTPTRSAPMTGRYPIRSGNHASGPGGNAGGLVAWERTMGDVLSDAGHATACFGKWHMGAEEGRWPTDHGFDEWYGPARACVKWGPFKIDFKRQQHFRDLELPSGFARITHLVEDPKERERVNQRYVRWWVAQHVHNAGREFEESVERERLIPAGSPLDFVPEMGGTARV